jgi:hypothetical protein
MKYLITENRLNSLTQRIIDETFDEFKNVCEVPDADTWPDWLSFDDCDSLESIEKIKVVNTQTLTLIKGFEKQYPTFGVDIDIHFSSIFASQDFSYFLIALAYRVKQKYKVNLMFRENESINTNTNRQW